MIRIKRVYEAPAKEDGYRVLVDRLWPRGVSKQKAALDLWLKDVAPSPELRIWFGHQPERFSEFSALYLAELDKNPATKTLLELHAKHQQLTLLYAAKNEAVNHALVLNDFLRAHI